MALYDSATTYDSAAVFDGIAATTRPTLRVRLATDFGGTSAVDISSSVRRVRINRGRGPLAFDTFDPGRCTLELVDFASTFYPANTSGRQPTVNTPVAVDMLWGSETVNLFYGFCDEIQTQWVPGASLAYTTMTFTDGMKLLANALITADGTTGDRPAPRILEMLAEINLGSSPSTTVAYDTAATYDTAAVYGGEYNSRSIDTLTECTLTSDPTPRRSALDGIRRVEAAEAGALFFDGAGRCCFRGRALAWPQGNPVVTFSDDTTADHVATYTAIKAVTDEQLLYNKVTATITDGIEQTAQNTSSQTTYFQRDLNKTGLLLQSDDQAATLATFLLAKRQTPLDRFEQIDMAAYASAVNLDTALCVDLLDIIAVKRTAPSYTSTTNLVVAGVQHDISPDDWRVSYTTQALV